MKYHGEEMPTINPTGCVAMTWEDAEAMENLNEKCGWGFTASNCLRFVADHLDADYTHRNETNPKNVLNAVAEKEKIEWRLEDANFHTFCGLLHDGKYADAIAWVSKDYKEYLGVAS